MDIIEQLLDKLEEYTLSCKTQAFSSTKIICEKEALLAMIRELRAKMPEELVKVQKMLANQNAIIENAKSKAAAIIAGAKEEAENLVKQDNIVKEAIAKSNNIMQNATERANSILQDAIGEATNIRVGAINYTDKIIAELENFVEDAYEKEKKYSTKLIEIYQEQLSTLQNNRESLNNQMDYIKRGQLNSVENEKVEASSLDLYEDDDINDIPDID